ncbi:hypothetical protein AB0425_40100 [Actinosynnema sp. NPDC051121]
MTPGPNTDGKTEEPAAPGRLPLLPHLAFGSVGTGGHFRRRPLARYSETTADVANSRRHGHLPAPDRALRHSIDLPPDARVHCSAVSSRVREAGR